MSGKLQRPWDNVADKKEAVSGAPASPDVAMPSLVIDDEIDVQAA